MLQIEEATTEGYIIGRKLAVPECPFCRKPHFHGNNDYKPGDVTGRFSHCQRRIGHYTIRIVGRMSPRKLKQIYERCQT